MCFDWILHQRRPTANERARCRARDSSGGGDKDLQPNFSKRVLQATIHSSIVVFFFFSFSLQISAHTTWIASILQVMILVLCESPCLTSDFMYHSHVFGCET